MEVHREIHRILRAHPSADQHRRGQLHRLPGRGPGRPEDQLPAPDLSPALGHLVSGHHGREQVQVPADRDGGGGGDQLLLSLAPPPALCGRVRDSESQGDDQPPGHGLLSQLIVNTKLPGLVFMFPIQQRSLFYSITQYNY